MLFLDERHDLVFVVERGVDVSERQLRARMHESRAHADAVLGRAAVGDGVVALASAS